MGKDKKKRTSGLADDILEGGKVKPSGRVKQRRARQGEGEDAVRSELQSPRFNKGFAWWQFTQTEGGRNVVHWNSHTMVK